MKRKISVLVSLLLAGILMASLLVPSFAAQENPLRFNANGKFTILQIADTQDIFIPRPATISAIEAALDRVKPDLVVFTGDNIYSPNCPTEFLVEIAIDAIIAPVAERNIPFTIIYGNHDGEGPISKEFQLSVYQKYPTCLAFDDAKEIYGTANHNLTIRSSNGKRDAFNLWMLDSGSFYEDGSVSKYDYVRKDQIDWYVKKSNALKAANGGVPLPSLVFQHIPVPEIFNVYVPAEKGAPGSNEYFGKSWMLKLNPAVASGTLLGWSNPPSINAGEFDAMAAQGDVIGIVTGHDHSNSFVGTYRGIDFIQTPNIGYSPANLPTVSGVRVITLDESNPRHYETEVITNVELFGTSLKGIFTDRFMGSVLSYPIAIAIFLGKLAERALAFLQ